MVIIYLKPYTIVHIYITLFPAITYSLVKQCRCINSGLTSLKAQFLYSRKNYHPIIHNVALFRYNFLVITCSIFLLHLSTFEHFFFFFFFLHFICYYILTSSRQ